MKNKQNRPTLITPIIIPTDEEIKQQPRTISLNKGKKRKLEFEFNNNQPGTKNQENTIIFCSSSKKIKLEHQSKYWPK
jgi:hypothetical protein